VTNAGDRHAHEVGKDEQEQTVAKQVVQLLDAFVTEKLVSRLKVARRHSRQQNDKQRNDHGATRRIVSHITRLFARREQLRFYRHACARMRSLTVAGLSGAVAGTPAGDESGSPPAPARSAPPPG